MPLGQTIPCHSHQNNSNLNQRAVSLDLSALELRMMLFAEFQMATMSTLLPFLTRDTEHSL
jgi:hypothetical protein